MLKYEKVAEAAIAFNRHLMTLTKVAEELEDRAKLTYCYIERALEVSPEWLDERAKEMEREMQRLMLDVENWKRELRLEGERQ